MFRLVIIHIFETIIFLFGFYGVSGTDSRLVPVSCHVDMSASVILKNLSITSQNTSLPSTE